MRTAITAALALALTSSAALSQTSSGSSASGGASSSGSTTTGIGRGAPALSPRPSGPVTPNRSNTDVFPPSRLLPPTGGSVSTQQTQTPGSTSAGTASASGTAATGQDASTTQGGASTATPDTSTSGTQANGSTTSDGQSGGTAGPIRPIPPNSQTSSGSGSGQPFSTRTGKNALNETVADCMKIWEPATHMSKADWQRTCRRVQGRLDQVTKEVLQK
jgi:hypothetical protein